MQQGAYDAVQVYVRLSEKLGLRDHLMVLTVILSKIGTNLKVFGSAEDVIQDTLTLFSVSCPELTQSQSICSNSDLFAGNPHVPVFGM